MARRTVDLTVYCSVDARALMSERSLAAEKELPMVDCWVSHLAVPTATSLVAPRVWNWVAAMALH